MMRGVVNGVRLDPDEFDWDATAPADGNWRYMLHRHFFLGTLYDAWRATGRPEYLARLSDWLGRWIARCPEPCGMNDGGASPAWSTLETAVRTGSWARIFFGTMGAREFPARLRLDMLKSFLAHAGHLHQWQGKDNNWVIIESGALLTAGVLFPEWKRSVAFRAGALERLHREMARQTWPDGVQTEIAPGYHWVCAYCCGDPVALAASNGHEVPARLAALVNRMADYPFYLLRPDRTRPSFNDSGAADGSGTDVLGYGVKKLGRADMQFVLTEGREGTPPAHTSRAFPDAGIYIMRSDWSRRANYLAFRGGRAGAAHGHEETGTFDLAAYCSPVIVDPGIHSYADDPIVAYLRSTHAANVLTVDGLEHCQVAQPYEHRTASVRDVNYWRSGEGEDVAVMLHAGPFGRGPDAVTDVLHQRELHFVKGRAARGGEPSQFWILADALWSDRPHVANILLHFMPMVVEVTECPLRIRTARQGQPNLEIVPLNSPEGTRARTWCGALDPMQGWVALGGEVAPAPCVQLDMPFAGHAVFVMLLAPVQARLVCGLSLVPLAPVAGGSGAQATSWSVCDAHGRALFEVHTPCGPAPPPVGKALPLIRVVPAV